METIRAQVRSPVKALLNIQACGLTPVSPSSCAACFPNSSAFLKESKVIDGWWLTILAPLKGVVGMEDLPKTLRAPSRPRAKGYYLISASALVPPPPEYPTTDDKLSGPPTTTCVKKHLKRTKSRIFSAYRFDILLLPKPVVENNVRVTAALSKT